jgi:hypothetical protein
MRRFLADFSSHGNSLDSLQAIKINSKKSELLTQSITGLQPF